MDGTVAATPKFDVRDVEYARHGDKPLLARIWLPEGEGPFPAVIHLHGGAWNQFDRTRDALLHEILVKAGITVVALDFRDGRDGGYPYAVVDINYAIRWVKAHAAELKTAPDMVALSGNSSGGHLAALSAMRPADERYTTEKLPEGAPDVDANVRAVVLFWPVINPYSRIRKALRQKEEGDIKQAPRTIHHHEVFWHAMEPQEDASPVLIAERGEKIALPPMILVQPKVDDSHNYIDQYSDFPGTEPERFKVAYEKLGGSVTLRIYDAPKSFISDHPDISESQEALGEIAAFIHQNIPASKA